MPEVTAKGMVGAIVLIFVIAILGAAFTAPLQDQVDAWKANLTANGQTTAAAVVGLIPLLFWVLLAVGIILVIVEMFLGTGGGLALLPFLSVNLVALMVVVLGLCVFALIAAALQKKGVAFVRAPRKVWN